SSAFVATGSHTYPEENSGLTITVQIQDQVTGDTGSGSSTATVADAPLTATGTTFSATAATPFTGAVGSFQDGNPGATATDFTATITWRDDGSTTVASGAAGTIVPNASGGFDIIGSHTFAATGTVPVQLSITDVGGSSATASSTA